MSEQRKPRGRPFKPGNPGRPLGSRNKATQMAEHLLEGNAQQLIQKVIDLAEAGNVACLRMVFDRLCPVRKGQLLRFEMPRMNSSSDVLGAYRAVLTAIANGQVTADEALALTSILETSLRAFEMDYLKRVDALEQEE